MLSKKSPCEGAWFLGGPGHCFNCSGVPPPIGSLAPSLLTQLTQALAPLTDCDRVAQPNESYRFCKRHHSARIDSAATIVNLDLVEGERQADIGHRAYRSVTWLDAAFGSD